MLVYVEWEDSCTVYGWRDPELDGPSKIKSVGHLVTKNNKFMVISTSQSESGRFVDQLTIPRSCIKKIKKVKV